MAGRAAEAARTSGWGKRLSEKNLMKNTLLPRTNTVLTRRYFLGGLGAAVALPLCDAEANGKSRTVLRERWPLACALLLGMSVLFQFSYGKSRPGGVSL